MPRRRRLKELREEQRTLVFYEAPHRIAALLGHLEGLFGGERCAVLARELSKRDETVCSDTLAGLAHRVAADEDQQRGEIVLVVAGAIPAAVKLDAGVRRTLYRLLLKEDGASPEEGAAPPIGQSTLAGEPRARRRRLGYISRQVQRQWAGR